MTQALDSNGTALAMRDQASIMEQVIAKGDLAQLSPKERVTYYREVCRSLGLNELTQPFGYIVLQGKTTLYPLKGCTDQLRRINHVNITRIEREQIGDLYVVTAYATCGDRTDSEIGAVPIAGLRGEALANAMMKAITKAKRRVTLAICGLGWTDESEIESIPGAHTIVVDSTTGEIIEERRASPLAKPETDMVTSADDRLWTCWCEIKDEAQSLGVRVAELTLPVARTLLITAGQNARSATNERLAQLAAEDAARAEHETRAAPAPATPARSQPGRTADAPPAEAVPPGAGLSRSKLWAERRNLEAKAPSLGVTVDTLDQRVTDEALADANATLREQIKAAEAAITGTSEQVGAF